MTSISPEETHLSEAITHCMKLVMCGYSYYVGRDGGYKRLCSLAGAIGIEVFPKNPAACKTGPNAR